MAALGLLLNPVEEPRTPSPSSHPPSQQDFPRRDRLDIDLLPRRLGLPRSLTSTPPSSPQIHQKLKLSKDSAVFTRGPIRGECRYPPDEFRDELLAAQHQQFEVYPMGDISQYPRHIPYNSEKKTFLDRTAREYFEVLQYTFRVPGEEKVHCMMWDYNIGLVRTTPLFKCTGYSKTTPAKMLNRNIGLREICHSITGGALVAQGYWMPCEAAKAIAATFCWKIRYALTPIFGRDFPAICIPPGSEKFGEMIIDSAITRRCTERARQYRLLETSTSARNTPLPITPDTPTYPRYLTHMHRKYALCGGSEVSSDLSDEESSYSLPPSTPSGSMRYRNVWTPVNTPRSVPRLDSCPSSPRRMPAEIARTHHRRGLSPGSDSSSPPLSPKSKRVRREPDRHAEERRKERMTLSREAFMGVVPSDEKAAYLLMSLKLGRVDARNQLRGIKRRGSA